MRPTLSPRYRPLAAALLFAAALAAPARAGDDPAPVSPPAADAPRSTAILIRPQDKIAFLGDSITQQGTHNLSGYVRLIHQAMKANDIPVGLVQAGVSGHKSNQMNDRLQKDVIDKRPQWMLLSCGVNDVWHGARGVPLADYKKNIADIVQRATDAGIRVVLLTSTPIKEEKNELNTQLAEYNDFLREFAKEKNLPLADLSAAFWAEIDTPQRPKPPGHYLTSDGVHMNILGNRLMADTILRTLGFNDEELEKAHAAWTEGTRLENIRPIITYENFLALNAKAAAEGKSVNDLMNDLVTRALQSAIEPVAQP